MTEKKNYFRERALKAEDRFFGEGNKHMVSNKYYEYKHLLDNDTVIINTGNVKYIKGKPVLIVGNNKAVYLKDWNIRAAHCYGDVAMDFYIVKLERQYFKVYAFKSDFDDFAFESDQTFDDLVTVAKDQDEKKFGRRERLYGLNTREWPLKGEINYDGR